MFCKNCGNQMNDVAAVCVKCGAAKGTGSGFCPNCGNPTLPGANACTNCGIMLNNFSANNFSAQGQQKSKIAAGLLGIFLGGLGIHNFYLGFNQKAIIQIVVSVVTCGAGSIWGFIEGILILCGNINTDANGIPLGE